MPKNIRGGKKFKKGKKGEKSERILLLANDNQHYAIINKILGGRPAMVDATVLYATKTDFIFKNKICHIRGKMHKKVWLRPGDWIIVSERCTNNDDKLDIIHKYNENEIRELHSMGEIDMNLDLHKDDGHEKDTNDVEITFNFDNV